jgi:hypothetical protein
MELRMEKGIMGKDPIHKERHEELYQKLKVHFDDWFLLGREKGVERLQEMVEAYLSSQEVMFNINDKPVLYDPSMDNDVEALEEFSNVLKSIYEEAKELRNNIIMNYSIEIRKIEDKITNKDLLLFIGDTSMILDLLKGKIWEIDSKRNIVEWVVNRIRTGYRWKRKEDIKQDD